jgi:hypothetical protein
VRALPIDCVWPYYHYFKRAGFEPKPFACQQGLPAGKSCSDLYAGAYPQPVVNGNTPSGLEGCITPCNPATELLLYEDRWDGAQLAECGTKVPNACDARYGVNNYAVLCDGADATGGAITGCLEFRWNWGELDIDQACPAGFDFVWFQRPQTTIRMPKLKECWKTNGGNANW